MTLEEARRILADENNADPVLGLEAVAVWLRFEGIADVNLLVIAEQVESVAAELRQKPH